VPIGRSEWPVVNTSVDRWLAPTQHAVMPEPVMTMVDIPDASA
jgi:hypothetical protein